MTSVRAGGRDVSDGLTVSNADVTGLVVSVNAPRDLPRIRGTVSGRSTPVTVDLRGPIVGTLTATTKNGTFEIPAATPGLYYLTVRDAPQLGTTPVVVGWEGASVQLKVP